MNHMRLWASAAIIAIIILVTFAISVPRTRDIEVKLSLPVATTSVPSVILRDAFKKGVHTISGSIEALNACTSVSASATLVGNASSTQNILVAISMEPDSGVCLQVPARISFQATISAPVNLPITATVNDAAANITSS